MGGGFAGIEVLKKLQHKLKNEIKDEKLEITLVSKDNFLLFTQMLPEVASGMFETRYITTPIRGFCSRTKFFEASLKSIDLNNKVIISHAIGNQAHPIHWDDRKINYDYLVIALGSETNFFGISNIEKFALKMKNIDDAITLRNHMISMLEQASVEQDKILRKNLLTFVVVGGGFSGIETVGMLNDFVKDTVRRFYKDISIFESKLILVNAHDKILPEIAPELGEFALKKLKHNGVQFIMNSHVIGATANTIKLDNGTIIPTFTFVWTAGVTPSNADLLANLSCSRDNSGKIIVNQCLEVPGYKGVYALGDCASIPDPYTGGDYPPTAQNAIEEGKFVADNIVCTIRDIKTNHEKIFAYKNKVMMTQIGKRTGVAQVFGYKFYGFAAWWLWRTYYLSNLPTIEKKLKVMGDWTLDLLLRPDTSMIKRFVLQEPDHNTIDPEDKLNIRQEEINSKVK